MQGRDFLFNLKVRRVEQLLLEKIPILVLKIPIPNLLHALVITGIL